MSEVMANHIRHLQERLRAAEQEIAELKELARIRTEQRDRAEAELRGDCLRPARLSP